MKENKGQISEPVLTATEPTLVVEPATTVEPVPVRKRDTAFVDVRKTMIEKYGNYYGVGLTDEEVIAWCDNELLKMSFYIANIEALKQESSNNIKAAKAARLAAIVAELGADDLEQLKLMIG